MTADLIVWMVAGGQQAGSLYSVETLDNRRNHILTWLEWDFTRFYHPTQKANNLKLMNCLILEFTFNVLDRS